MKTYSSIYSIPFEGQPDPTPPTDELTTSTGIIYRITNIPEGKIYIGQAKGPFTKRYRGGRWWTYSHNEELKADYKRLGKNAFGADVVAEGFSAVELSELEEFLIRSHNSLHPNGYNKVCRQGVRQDVCASTRLKMSHSAKERMKRGNPFQGKKHTEETKEVIRQKNLGKKLSPEHRAAISASAPKGKNHPWHTGLISDAGKARTKAAAKMAKRATKAVLKSDVNSGHIIARFDSVIAAQRETGIPSQNIGRSCRVANMTAGGFKWMYEDGSSPTRSDGLRLRSRPVIQINADTGEAIARFESVAEAARVLGVPSGSLHACVMQAKKCKGYQWKFHETC